MQRTNILFILAAAWLLSNELAQADETFRWPRWRGPGDNGSIDGADYPVKWSDAEGVLWKTPLPGKGCSTPIVSDGRIFLTAPSGGQDAVLALDLAGKLLWTTTLGPERPGKNRNGSGSNPSAVTDGQAIFAYFKSGTLAGLDLEGKVRWKVNLQQLYGRDTLYWDIGSSPVLTDADVVAAVMHHGESYLVAFDKASGKPHWKVARNYPTPEEGDHSYTTPIVFSHEGRQAVLVWGGQHATAHDAADGRTIWSCGEFNPESNKNWVAVASPVLAAGVAIVPFGRGNRLHGIRLGGSGDVTATHRAWLRTDSGSFVPTPAEHKGKVYLLRDRGEIECIDPASGKSLWAGSLPKKPPNYYASPLVCGNKLYAIREDGVAYVASIDGKLDVLAENNMGERVIASPVPLPPGRLLIRGEKNLFCIGK